MTENALGIFITMNLQRFSIRLLCQKRMPTTHHITGYIHYAGITFH